MVQRIRYCSVLETHKHHQLPSVTGRLKMLMWCMTEEHLSVAQVLLYGRYDLIIWKIAPSSTWPRQNFIHQAYWSAILVTCCNINANTCEVKSTDTMWRESKFSSKIKSKINALFCLLRINNQFTIFHLFHTLVFDIWQSNHWSIWKLFIPLNSKQWEVVVLIHFVDTSVKASMVGDHAIFKTTLDSIYKISFKIVIHKQCVTIFSLCTIKKFHNGEVHTLIAFIGKWRWQHLLIKSCADIFS